jgi:cytoskeletal protein CcmA (bactofilin family)
MISIIGPGMRVLGDCSSDGTIRIEGSVQGEVFAGKAIVVGKEGVVTGDLRTQDAVIAGQVDGSVIAASRLEVQATARIQGVVHARRLQLEEGALLNGEVRMGEIDLGATPMAEELPVASDLFERLPSHEGAGRAR